MNQNVKKEWDEFINFLKKHNKQQERKILGDLIRLRRRRGEYGRKRDKNDLYPDEKIDVDALMKKWGYTLEDFKDIKV